MDTGTQSAGMKTASAQQTVVPHGHLPRLQPEAYRGYAMVHWTMSLLNRTDGWLDETSHARFRELALHTAAGNHFLIPAYCVMPNHVHLLTVGVRAESDQKRGMAFLRRQFNDLLTTRYRARLQKQAYDNVLREKDRERGAFQSVAHYILENPVRAGLVKVAGDWSFSGCVAPGHPGWDVFHPKYWETFWKVYADLCNLDVAAPDKAWPTAPETPDEDHALSRAATPMERGIHTERAIPNVAAPDTAWPARRFGRTATLRPGAEAEYDRLHAAVWPEVLAAVERAGIRNYSIFRQGRRLFSYFEIPGSTDLAEVTRVLFDEPVCRRWEDVIQKLQKPPSDAVGAAWWTPMKEIFHSP